MNPYLKSVIVSVFLAVAVLGCSTQPKDPPPSSIKAIDSTVVTTCKLNLKSDIELASSDIKVSAENDLLVLRGTVPSEEAKAKAEQIALKTARVEKVANHLEVKPQ
jgi:osmotically-inducible protein OsmY